MSRPRGRPRREDRQIGEKYGLTERQSRRRLTTSFKAQLDSCASDEARRLILNGFAHRPKKSKVRVK
jgi:hypothetical protein